LDVQASGSGDLEAGRLNARKAMVRSDGPGDVVLATVSDTLDAEMHGSGGLTAAIAGKRLQLKLAGPGGARIEGSVDQVNAQVSGSGSLAGHRLTAGHADLEVHGPGNAVVNLAQGGKQAGRADLLVVDRSGSHRRAE
jgi:hypothetical protein